MGVCICDIIILNRGIKYHMTTATEVGLLQAIISEPAANDLRLIYADWLEENGQPERAEFIRVQIELASMDWDYERDERDDRKYAHYAALRGRERELLSTMLDTSSNGRRASTMAGYLWAKEVLGRHVAVWPHTFRRGFVAEVTCTLADWMGKECQRCGGLGALDRGSLKIMPGFCFVCHGTSRVGGHGPAIVKAAPLEVVRLTDVAIAPIQLRDGRSVWVLPETELRTLQKLWDVTLTYHNTRQDALNALSAALLAWAHQENNK